MPRKRKLKLVTTTEGYKIRSMPRPPAIHKVPVAVLMETHIHRDLKLLAKGSGKTVAYWVREALRSLFSGSDVLKIVRAEKQKQYNRVPRKKVRLKRASDAA